jgi:hypothetical protein
MAPFGPTCSTNSSGSVGDAVADLLFGLLRTEDGDDVASKIAARAAKFPQLLEGWCRELAEWFGPLPTAVEQQLTNRVRERLKR